MRLLYLQCGLPCMLILVLAIGANFTRKSFKLKFTRENQFHTWLRLIALRPKKKIVVFQVPCQKKTGSVGRLYFFFFFFFFLDKT